jgi:hypothetical protein
MGGRVYILGILKFVTVWAKLEGRRQRHGRQGDIDVGRIM